MRVFVFLFFILCGSAFGLTTSDLPRINNLKSSDPVFKNLTRRVEYNDKIHKNIPSDNDFYIYEARKGDTLLHLHSLTGIPYDTIVTLNHIPNMTMSLTGKTLIIPCVKGIFIGSSNKTSIDNLVYTEMGHLTEGLKTMQIDNEEFYFLEGKRFTPTMRFFFLDTSYVLPVDKVNISSPFGYRKSPVYGAWKLHKGVDFASREGDQIYACKSGKVKYVYKNDPTFGNYVILEHENGVTSVYAHMSKILVKPDTHVGRGEVIGLIGQTGKATGPHLHFEIRQNGNANDPLDYMGLK